MGHVQGLLLEVIIKMAFWNSWLSLDEKLSLLGSDENNLTENDELAIRSTKILYWILRQ